MVIHMDTWSRAALLTIDAMTEDEFKVFWACLGESLRIQGIANARLDAANPEWRIQKP